MKCYRIKHIPSGLYFKPSYQKTINQNGHRCWVKSNLSKLGKVYNKMPTLKYIGEGIYNHTSLIDKSSTYGKNYDSRYEKFITNEWSIEEIK